MPGAVRLRLVLLAVFAALAAAPVAGANIVLYDQYDNAGAIATSSQNYESAFNLYDDEAADDFVVTDGSGWLVNQVEVEGQYFNGPGPATSVNVRFFADASGLPGTLIAERLNANFTVGPEDGDFVIPLDQAVPLGPGTYWLSVQANENFTISGQWGWTDRTVSAHMGAAWRNPPGGYATACTNWGRRPTTCGIDPAAPDQVFRLLGNVGAGGPALVHDQATVYDEDADGLLEPGESFELDDRRGDDLAAELRVSEHPRRRNRDEHHPLRRRRVGHGHLRHDPPVQRRRRRGRRNVHGPVHGADDPVPQLRDHDADRPDDRAGRRGLRPPL